MSSAPVALALALAACHEWPSRPVGNLGTGGRTIRIVTADGRRRVVLESARVVGDSVIGRLVSTDTLGAEGWARLRPGTNERTAIAVSAITRVEVRQLNKRRTLAPLALLGVAAVVTVTIVLVRAMLSLYGN
jgi:hypothetical protein